MEQVLSHLPPEKRDELGRAVELIRDGCPGVGAVLLFGSYARGDWREEGDLPPKRRSGHASDYDLLAITDDDQDCESRTWLAIARACDEAGLSTHVRIIHLEIGYLNRKLAKGQYFYSEIVTEGKVLWREPGFDLAAPALPDREERLRAAREGFGHWFEKASRFFAIHESTKKKGWLPEAAFHLHQAAEAAYKAVLLVHTGYIPNEHYLALLGQKAEEVDARLAGLFPRESEFQSDAYELLDYAYIGARYDPQYRIDSTTVEYLGKRVATLLKIAETVCEEKIAGLELSA
ncbi:HEPN domain-containing protein [Thiohalomonas denitrificans]|uniref:HEPN domain-containing protein n=1 Tax=Thiohalomonas denitrificans TaxID=415747 RepID=UPI0026ED41D9|nr:HEPN domain-containing protein [Thiohalomonas denitrificans]